MNPEQNCKSKSKNNFNDEKIKIKRKEIKSTKEDESQTKNDSHSKPTEFKFPTKTDFPITSEKKYIKQIPKGFKRYNLHEKIAHNIQNLGYKQPTPIQKRTIPEILNGNNVIVKSRTGSGKSAAFIIPTLQRLVQAQAQQNQVFPPNLPSSSQPDPNTFIQVAILSPSRELAKQTLDFYLKLSKGLHLRFALMTGGDKIEKQFERLQNKPHLVIATPGRLVQHLEEGSVFLNRLQMLVVDEADKLFEQGFEEQIKQIVKFSPAKKQIALFSATIPDNLASFMKLGVTDYQLITLGEENRVPSTLRVDVLCCREEEKLLTLVVVLRFVVQDKKIIVFCPTKQHCEYLVSVLECYGVNAISIYGKMEQVLRDSNLKKFKNNEVNILVVTDLAARGLDIPQLDVVVNFDFPDKPRLFVHRVGRTARAEKSGQVISLVSSADWPYLCEVHEFIGREFNLGEENKKSGGGGNEELNEFDFIHVGKVGKDLYSKAESCFSEYLNNKIELDDLKNSMTNSLMKKASFKVKPKPKYVKMARAFKLSAIPLSPMLNGLGGTESSNKLADLLKSFKPKATVFEFASGNSKSESLKRYEKFNNDIKKNKLKAQLKLSEEQNKEEIDEDLIIDNDDINNLKSLNFTSLNSKNKLFEKESTNNEENSNLLNQKRKRSQLKSFKSTQYVSNSKDDKVSAKLWGNEQPVDLNEITLNLATDEDFTKKTYSKYAWNAKLNRYVSGNVDSKGNYVKKNTSGVKIRKDEKKPNSFKRWLSTHKRGANSAASGNFKNNSQGGELKSFNQIVKQRKDSIKKQHKFHEGQVRKLKEKKIGDKVHLNRKSFAIVKKRKFKK